MSGHKSVRHSKIRLKFNLTGEKALVNVFQDSLTVGYQEQRLFRYSVEWQPDERSLARVGNPRPYKHPYLSPQLELWPVGSVEWSVILRAHPYGPRPVEKKKRLIFFQYLLLEGGDGTQG